MMGFLYFLEGFLYFLEGCAMIALGMIFVCLIQTVIILTLALAIKAAKWATTPNRQAPAVQGRQGVQP